MEHTLASVIYFFVTFIAIVPLFFNSIQNFILSRIIRLFINFARIFEGILSLWISEKMSKPADCNKMLQ